MPFYKQINISKNSKIGIWKITEDIEELTKKLPQLQKPPSKNDLKANQWLATRILLKEFFSEEFIHYDEFGKPYLTNGWHISISHANEFVCLILNQDSSCGIDIEKITPKIERIKHKFLSSADLQKITSLEDLTIYWSAKEALYKYYGKKEVLFIENLFIENFNLKNPEFTGRIEMPNFKINIPLNYKKIEDYILVYTL